MLTVLFWNLMGNERDSWPQREPMLRASLARTVAAFDVDLVALVESGFEPDGLAAALSRGQDARFTLPPNPEHRVQILTRLPPTDVRSQFDSVDGRLTIRRVFRRRTDFLLAALHMPSPRNASADDRLLHAAQLREDLLKTEATVGHRRTLLVGDLNMNPFDPGVVGALSAVMTQEIAAAGERTVAGRAYPFFYNPMWGCFGDRTAGPPGTLFYSTSELVNRYWNVYDQVLVRPDLMGKLADVRILDGDGQESLLTDRGRPRRSELSDHLPILCRLRI